MGNEIASALIGGCFGVACAYIGVKATLRQVRQASEEQAAARAERAVDRSRRAAFAATEIAPVLRDFAKQSLAVTHDDGFSQYHRDDGLTEATAQVSIPEFSQKSFQIDWLSLPPDLMAQVRTFEERIRFERRQLDDGDFHDVTHDYPGHGRYFLERQSVYARLGIEALALAEKLYKNAHLDQPAEADFLRHELLSQATALSEQRIQQEQRDLEEMRSVNELLCPSAPAPVVSPST